MDQQPKLNPSNSTNLPPRKFPEKQYRKLSHKIWITFVGVIIIVILVILGLNHFNSHPAHHPVQHTSTEKMIRTKRHRTNNPTKKKPDVSVKQGEKLLGKWLIKLGYTPKQCQQILAIYQHSNVLKEKAINQKLVKLNNGSMPNANKRALIQQYLRQKFTSRK